jgi:hypothetical protein
METDNSYGCKIVHYNELPNYINIIIQRMELNRPIKVPLRKNGMTSSGIEYHCHPNVQLLVNKFGGKRLVGYILQETSKKYNRVRTKEFELFYHSVWITPEDITVDVTKKSDVQIKSMINKNHEFQYFIPVTTEDQVLSDFITTNRYKIHGYGHGVFPKDIKKEDWDNPTLKDLTPVGLKQKDMFGENWFEEGKFNLPSIVTGKTWDQISSEG